MSPEPTSKKKGLEMLKRIYGALMLAITVCLVAMVSPAAAHATSRYTPVEAKVPVEVTVSGDALPADADARFTFKMTAADGEKVLPSADTLTVDGAGQTGFSLAYDEVGEHHYTVTQVAGGTDNVTYDARAYDVTVYCMWDESTDALFTKVIVKDSDGFKAASCAFENSYAAPAAPASSVKPAGGKLAGTGDATDAGWVVLLAGAVAAVAVGAGLRRRA